MTDAASQTTPWMIQLTPLERSKLKKVGFWGGDAVPWQDAPVPEDFVDLTWSSEERARVSTYLGESPAVECAMFSATCRICGKRDGRADWVTDGVWVWPADFRHYLDAHQVKPPAGFLEHIQRMQFRLPAPLVPAETTIERIASPFFVGLERTDEGHALLFRPPPTSRKPTFVTLLEVRKETGCYQVTFNPAYREDWERHSIWRTLALALATPAGALTGSRRILFWLFVIACMGVSLLLPLWMRRH